MRVNQGLFTNACRKHDRSEADRFGVPMAIAILLLGLSANAYATTTFYVATDGDDANSGLTPGDAWSTVQKALNTMLPGDSVRVANGIYSQSLQTSRSGTSSRPITLVADGDSVVLACADDLPDSLFTKTPGFNHIYQLSHWHAYRGNQTGIHQTHFPDFVINDPNPSRFTMTDRDGPIPLTSAFIPSLDTLDVVEGAFRVEVDSVGGVPIDTTLYVHPQGSLVPGTATTDLWAIRGQPALVIEHDNITIDGFRFMYANGSGGGLTVSNHTGVVVRNCDAVASSITILGHDNRIENMRSTHNFLRLSSSHEWFTGNSGSGISLQGTRLTMTGGEMWHNWNNVSSNGDSLTVDGLVIHGAPNHAWLPNDCRGLTIRNVVEYNCQDGFYLQNCEDVLIENCTSFSGIFVQRSGTGTPGVGPITVRNSILMGGMDFLFLGGAGGPVDAAMESRITFENNIIFRTGAAPFNHIVTASPLVKLPLDLSAYISHAAQFPLEPHATMSGNVQLNSGFSSVIAGGAWPADQDSWDVHITSRSSPGYNAGSPEAGAALDFEGDARPAGGAYDIGADEFSEASGPPLPAFGLGAAPSGTVDRGINLSWSHSHAGSVVDYLIYRSSVAFGDTTAHHVATVGGSTAFADTTLSYGVFHYIVFARNDSGLVSTASNEAVATAPDHASPAAPGPLAGSAPGFAFLAWAPSASPDVRRYRVHADTVVAPAAVVDSSGSGQDTTRTITGLVPGSFYHFRVSAVDSSGNVSGFSNEITLQPAGQFPGPPEPASGLLATPSATTDRGIALTWLPSVSGDIAHYHVYRDTVAVADTTGHWRATVGIVPAYTDTTPAYAPFHYVVFAMDDSGEVSVASNQAFTIAPDRLAPSAPGTPLGTPGPHKVSLSWPRSPEPDVRGYRVYLGTAPQPTTLADSTWGATDTSAVATPLPAETLYYFRVTAVDSSGNESGYSPGITASPLGVTPNVTTSFFPNPVVLGALEVVVVSTVNLMNAPVVRLTLPPDTASVAIGMTSIRGLAGAYHGKHGVLADGNYRVETRVTTEEGVEGAISRDFATVSTRPGAAARLVSPDGAAVLELAPGAIRVPALVLAEGVTDEGAYRFSGSTNTLARAARLAFQYDPAAVVAPGTLAIEEWDGGSWTAIATRVYRDRTTAEAAIDRMGTYRLREIPGATFDNTVPLVFGVRAGYPNPFGATTMIAYDLPDRRAVTVGIYDPLGRRVVDLVRGTQEAGRHVISWSGRNGGGERVAGGIYFARVAAGPDVRVLKLAYLNR